MPRARRKRTVYSLQKRTTILAAAEKEGLTALQVKQRFGVTPVTYYSWRRKYRGGAAPVARNGRGRGGDLAQQVRSEVQAKVRLILPGIVRSEVSNYLDSLFRSRGRARSV
jgi:transposase-like protein